MQSELRECFERLARLAGSDTATWNQIRRWVGEASEPKDPVSVVQWVPIAKVHANDYNPNAVAKNEMRLLYTSIFHDGFTQPVVVVRDEENDRYVIVDGFHRFSIVLLYADIRERLGGMLPIVVLDKPINDRMASTVRHNRARGKHSIKGMGSMVFQMLENGMKDEAICKELGLEADELLRLKHVTGFSKLFENVEYRRAWVTRSMVGIKKEWEAENGSGEHSGGSDKAVLAEPTKE